MESLSPIKPFLPFLLTFFVPRAIGYYRTVKTTIRTRPPAGPLQKGTTQSLNVLFSSICLFFFMTLPVSFSQSHENVFQTTNSRLYIPTDVLFSRLAVLRPHGLLTSSDDRLKAKITTPLARQLYLRFGPVSLADCSFCHPDDDSSYLLYHLPANVLLPHLLHLILLGLSTSEPVACIEASRWRSKFTLGALAIALADVYFTAFYNPAVDGNVPSPNGLFWTARLFRPLILCLYDTCIAFLLYASATNRFGLFISSSDLDPEVARKRQEQLLAQTNVSLQMAHTKLRAFSIVRNATVRNPELKANDDEYWRAVISMEGLADVDGVWDDEEVQAAMARVTANGAVDISRMGREAESFVANVTRDLDHSG